MNMDKVAKVAKDGGSVTFVASDRAERDRWAEQVRASAYGNRVSVSGRGLQVIVSSRVGKPWTQRGRPTAAQRLAAKREVNRTPWP